MSIFLRCIILCSIVFLQGCYHENTILRFSRDRNIELTSVVTANDHTTSLLLNKIFPQVLSRMELGGWQIEGDPFINADPRGNAQVVLYAAANVFEVWPTIDSPSRPQSAHPCIYEIIERTSDAITFAMHSCSGEGGTITRSIMVETDSIHEPIFLKRIANELVEKSYVGQSTYHDIQDSIYIRVYFDK